MARKPTTATKKENPQPPDEQDDSAPPSKSLVRAELLTTVSFKDDLGHPVTVQTTLADVYDLQRRLGAAGWTPPDLPPGGFQFPYDLEENFDWRLIGARKITLPDNEVIVVWRGQTFKRRELPATPGTSRRGGRPAAIRYSRGARPLDPPHIVEEADGDIGYVALAVFKGKGADRYRHLMIPTTTDS